MKQLGIFLMAMLLAFTAEAQTIFEELVDQYVDVEGFSAVQITNDMFDLYLKQKNIDSDDPVYEVLDDLDNMMVISQTFTGDNDQVKEEMKTMIRDYYRENDYTLFKTEKNASSDLKIYIDKTDESITSMGLLSSNSFSVNLIEMNGNIDLSKIASLNKALNIRGLEQLQVFDNKKSPSNFYFNYEFELPDMSTYELSEERRREIQEHVQQAQEEMRKHQEEMKIHQREMNLKQRELFEKYNKFPVIISGPDGEDAEYYVNGRKVDKDEIKELDPESIRSIEIDKKDESKKQKAQIKIFLKESK